MAPTNVSTAARTGLPVDPVTGLPGEEHATAFLDGAWGFAVQGNDVAVVLFEIDELRRVLTEHGHTAADEACRALSALISERIGPGDLCARWGSRFQAILIGRRRSRAQRFAADVAARFAETDFGWGQATARYGVSSADQGIRAPDVLLAAADRALYLAATHEIDEIVRLPSRPAPRPSTNGLRDCRVLVVDDDEPTLRSTRRMLERLGCVVTSAGSSREALATVTGDGPLDLLVTDIVMPEMSGFTLVEVASRARADLPVLYMSGYPQDEVYWGGTPGARSSFLGKPMEIGDLSGALHALLGLAAPAKKVRSGGMRRRPRGAEPTLEGRILIVDDDEAVVGSLQRLFRRAGYEEPIGLIEPRRVADVLSEAHPDLIILDLNMPGMDGFQVMDAIAPYVALEEYLPILMLTGDDAPEVRRRALEAGAMDFLTKPFDPAEAEARVRNLLATRALTQRVSDRRALLEEQVLERTADLADTRTEILHRLARAAEYRDDVTGRHAERVGMLASLIASELGWDAREVDLLRRTAPLHDIGKIGVPDEVLRKPGRLTPEEFELMKMHTVIGERILGGSRHRILQMASSIARGHHERWDGLGYPDGLARGSIPLEARIVTVADVFDVLSHSRPYKSAYDPTITLERIVTDRGTHFDPEVVDALCAIFERVGAEGFLELADPIDPMRDINPDAPAP